MTVAAPTADGLRGRVLRGVAWKATSQVFLQATRMAVAIVLARLLSPHDYGVAGMALVFSSLVLVFSDLGFGAALVQRKEVSERDRSTVFWIGAAAGLVFTAAGIALSGPIAAFYHQPALQPLLAAFSVSFLVTSLGSTQAALLTRDLEFRSLELRNMTAFAAAAVVGISAAAAGLGAWALILQQLAIALVSTTLLWRFSRWKPKLIFSRASLRSLGGFSGNVLTTRILFFANRNADNVLIGKFAGASALGAYSVAYNLMLVPFSQIAEPIQQVLLPAFSRMQDDPRRMAEAWLRANRLIAAISLPALAGLVVVAPDFVRVALGQRWHEVAPVLQVLAWVGMIQSLQRLNSSVLQARDRTGPLVRYSVVVLCASLIAFGVGLRWGVLGVAIGYAISSTFVEPYYTLITIRALEMSILTFLRSLVGIVQATLVLVGCTAFVRLSLERSGVPIAGRLVVVVAVGALVYLPACLWRAPEVRGEIGRLRRARFARESIV